MWRLLRAEARFMATPAARATRELIGLADRASTSDNELQEALLRVGEAFLTTTNGSNRRRPDAE
jgi:hypothetical protein